MKLALNDLAATFKAHKESFEKGCMVDTNALFAAAFPLDHHNEWAEKVFDELHRLDIPIYTNLNIRSEFIELSRRVLIPEGLVSLYDDLKGTGTLDPALEHQLKSLKTQANQAVTEDKHLKYNDQQIKKYRDLLSQYQATPTHNAWELFCEDYFGTYLAEMWEDTVKTLRVNFVSSRGTEDQEKFENRPDWKGMTAIMGVSGIGSSDAMILNLFLCSRFPLIVSTDHDVTYTIEKLATGTKFVLAP
jgi:predicted nucleic acid-binding protein